MTTNPTRFNLDRAEQAIGSDAPIGAVIAAIMALAEAQETANLIGALGATFASGQPILTDAEQTEVSRTIAARLGLPAFHDESS
jgi:hypothetical protein